jgi:hypothetical protein
MHRSRVLAYFGLSQTSFSTGGYGCLHGASRCASSGSSPHRAPAQRSTTDILRSTLVLCKLSAQRICCLFACRTTFLRDTMKYTVIKVGAATTASVSNMSRMHRQHASFSAILVAALQ